MSTPLINQGRDIAVVWRQRATEEVASLTRRLEELNKVSS